MNALQIELNLRSNIPIYVQIMDQIKHKIVAEELNPGDQLPTVRQVAADLRINFNTVARAYRMLDEAGIISTQHGRGTFILEPRSEEESEQLRQEGLLHLTLDYLIEADRLGFSPQEVRAIFEEKYSYWESHGTPPGSGDE